MATVAELMVKINGDISGLQKSIQGAGDNLKNFGSSMTATGGTLTKGFTVPIAAGVAVVASLAKDAIGYQGQMNEVFTLMPGITDKAMGDMSADVLQFAKDMGVIPQEVAPALYQAISAGVPADNVFSFLEIAQKAAVGGVTDLTTAVDGISTVVNSYGEDVIDAAKASDLMFTAVRLGKTTFEELSASLFNTLPTASALGVSFEDVTGAMASMTAQGVPTSVATTQMRQLLVELSKDGGQAAKTFEQLSGQTFKDFIASGGDVAGALGIMHEHAQDTGKGINDLFSSVEAGNAALALAGDNAQSYIDNVNEMQGAAGATQTAFEKMEEGVGRELEKLAAWFAVTRLEIGTMFLPMITGTLIPIFQDTVIPMIKRLADFVAMLAEKFSELSPTTQKVILGAIALLAALGPVLVIAGMMVSAIGALIPVFAALLGPIGLVIGIIAALIAIGIYLYKNWDEIKAKAVEIWTAIKDFYIGVWTAIWDFIVGLFDRIKNFYIETWTNLWNTVVEWNDKVRNSIKEIWDKIIEFFKGLPGKMIEFGKNIIQGLVTGIKNMASAVWEALKGVVGGAIDKVKSFLGLSSPSKLFQGFGSDIGQGLIIGMDRMRDSVGLSMQNMIPEPRLNLAVAGATSMGSISSGGNVNNFYIDQMNVRDDQDVEKIARELYRLQTRRDRGVN